MIEHLEDPENILLTRNLILPRFLRQAMIQLTPEAYLNESEMDEAGCAELRPASNA